MKENDHVLRRAETITFLKCKGNSLIMKKSDHFIKKNSHRKTVKNYDMFRCSLNRIISAVWPRISSYLKDFLPVMTKFDTNKNSKQKVLTIRTIIPL